MDFVNYYESPLGKIKLSSNGTKLTGLCFFDQNNYAETMDSPHSEKELPVFTLTKSWLAIYFAGRRPNFSPELTFKGTVFQERVWNKLQKIPDIINDNQNRPIYDIVPACLIIYANSKTSAVTDKPIRKSG